MTKRNSTNFTIIDNELIQRAGYESTVFITNDRKEESFYGKNVYRVLFIGIHFKTGKPYKN